MPDLKKGVMAGGRVPHFNPLCDPRPLFRSTRTEDLASTCSLKNGERPLWGAPLHGLNQSKPCAALVPYKRAGHKEAVFTGDELAQAHIRVCGASPGPEAKSFLLVTATM